MLPLLNAFKPANSGSRIVDTNKYRTSKYRRDEPDASAGY